MRYLLTAISAACMAVGGSMATAESLSLAYFMGPKHPMNAAVFTPFAEALEEASAGELTIQQFPGGALNSVPPKQYSILLDGVADIVFAIPGYTGDVFPMSQIVGLPDVCFTATECTEALIRARSTLETEFNAKLLAMWATSPPVIITRDTPIRSMEDLQGMTLRVTNNSNIPFVEALGASAVAQPVSVINQNLTNGVIDGIIIDASAIRSFKLDEPGNYVTTWFPASGSPLALLMNLNVYNGMTDEQRSWIDAAADDALSLGGGMTYDRAAQGGLALAKESGLEIIELSDEERARWTEAVAPTLAEVLAQPAGALSAADVRALMTGQ